MLFCKVTPSRCRRTRLRPLRCRWSRSPWSRCRESQCRIILETAISTPVPIAQEEKMDRFVLPARTLFPVLMSVYRTGNNVRGDLRRPSRHRRHTTVSTRSARTQSRHQFLSWKTRHRVRRHGAEHAITASDAPPGRQPCRYGAQRAVMTHGESIGLGGRLGKLGVISCPSDFGQDLGNGCQNRLGVRAVARWHRVGEGRRDWARMGMFERNRARKLSSPRAANN